MIIELRSGKVKQIRKNGFIPGVMYGHGTDPISVQAEETDFKKTLHQFGTSKTFSIKLDGKNHIVYIKDVQKGFMGQGFECFDLMRVTKKDTLHAAIPLHFHGKDHFQSTTVHFQEYLHELNVEYHVGEGITHLDIDVTGLRDGHPIHVKDLDLPDGVIPMHEPDDIVCALGHRKVVIEEEETSDEVPVVYADEEEPQQEE